jgi:hypothetical protein
MASPPFTIISDNIKYSELSVVTDNIPTEVICQGFNYKFLQWRVFEKFPPAPSGAQGDDG